ncbi:hypothetical protein D3C86_1627790 [compost metagenome]
MHHPVLHALEVVQAVQGAHVRLQAPQFQRLANGLANVEADHVIADFRVVLDLDSGDDRRALVGRAGSIEHFVCFQGPQPGQAGVEHLGGTIACIDDFPCTDEVSRAKTRQRRLDEDVVGFQGCQLLF